jgi:hypothetical protein
MFYTSEEIAVLQTRQGSSTGEIELLRGRSGSQCRMAGVTSRMEKELRRGFPGAADESRVMAGFTV